MTLVFLTVLKRICCYRACFTAGSHREWIDESYTYGVEAGP